MHLVFIEAINKVKSFRGILIVELQCFQSPVLYGSLAWSEGLVVLRLEELATVKLPLNREAQPIVINDLSILSNKSLVFSHRIILLQPSINFTIKPVTTKRSEVPSAFSSTFSFFSSCFALRLCVAVVVFCAHTAFFEALGIYPLFFLRLQVFNFVFFIFVFLVHHII
jgi:hypothetical protein